MQIPASANLSINRKSNAFVKVVITLIVFLLIIFGLKIFSSPIKGYFFFALSPIQKVFWTAGQSSSTFISSLLKSGSLYQENQKLEDDNRKLLLQVIALQQITEDNSAQSAVSTVCQSSGFEVLMAGVIGLDGDDVISINKGLDDGVQEEMPVINEQNVLYGKVYKSSKNFSQIMLISNKSSVINVKIQQLVKDEGDDVEGIKEVEGILKGWGGFKVYLDLVPINEEIQPGNTLFTSSLEGVFPKGLLVGTVVSIEKNDQKPFQQANVKPFLETKNLDNLFVITNYKR